MLAELAPHLPLELDFRLEAANAARCRAFFAPGGGGSALAGQVVVPAVHAELSSTRSRYNHNPICLTLILTLTLNPTLPPAPTLTPTLTPTLPLPLTRHARADDGLRGGRECHRRA